MEEFDTNASKLSEVTAKLMASLELNKDYRPLQILPVIARIYGSYVSHKHRNEM